MPERLLTTVTDGMRSAGFNAVRALNQCADDTGDMFSPAKRALKSNCYMDDLLTGADSAEEALELRAEIIHSSKSGGFEFCKWLSNDDWIRSLMATEGALGIKVFAETDIAAGLGLKWNTGADKLGFKVKWQPPTGRPTMWKVLSEIARCYYIDSVSLFSHY